MFRPFILGLRARSSSAPLREEVDRRLEELYAGLPDVHDLPTEELRLIDKSGGHQAYGELCPSGVRNVMQRLAPRIGDVVADLGSGCGRMVLQCALEWPTLHSVVGVELSVRVNVSDWYSTTETAYNILI